MENVTRELFGKLRCASHFKLDNLKVILDLNSYQQTGSTNNIMNTNDLSKNGSLLTGMFSQ